MGYLTVLPTSCREEWNRALEEAKIRDIYYEHRYLCMAEDNGEGEASLAVFRSSDGLVLYPFLLREIDMDGHRSGYKDITSPYGYAGPLVLPSNGGNEVALAKAFRDCMSEYMAGERVVCEFVRFHPLLQNVRLMSALIPVQHVRETVYVDLRCSAHEIWTSSISSKTRNHIRKAIKVGVRVAERGGEAIKDFRQLYIQTMDRVRAGSYYYFSDAYFSRLAQIVAEEGVVLEASVSDRLVASVVLFASGPFAHYHLSASDPAFRSVPGTDLLLWEGIKWAKERGARYFHLGGGYSGTHDTLFRFKAGFSPLRANFHVGRVVVNPEVYEEFVSKTGTSESDYFPKYRDPRR